MKKLIVVPVVFLMLVFCNTNVSQAVTLGFYPVSQDVLVGDPADVELVISGLGDYSPDSLSAFDLDIGFDPTILGFDSVTFGSCLGDPCSVETSHGFTDYGTGTVNIWELSWLYANQASDSFYDPLVPGSGYPPYLDDIQPSSFTLATLTFDTLALGTSFLDITINLCGLGDAYGDPLSADLLSGSISVVPEPATLLLLGSGLVGLGYLRKRKTSKVS